MKNKSIIKFVSLFAVLAYAILFFLGNYSSTIIQSLYGDKVWMHRVNSTEKLQKLYDEFTGFELDLVFNETKNIFDVNHPPAESINLSLEEYLGSVKLDTSKHFWLDVKNLSPANAEACLKRIEEICTKLEYAKHQILVESPQPELLSRFNKAGFETSYYITMNFEELEANELVLEKVKLNFNSAPSTYISSNYRNFEALTKLFPEKQILSWSLPYQKNSRNFNPFQCWKNVKSLRNTYHILSNDQLKVFLFKNKSVAGHR